MRSPYRDTKSYLVCRFLVCFFIAAFCFNSCFLDKSAGTSSGTDNPEIAFTEEEHSTVVTGTLDLYLADQNTILYPDPILSYTLEQAEAFTLPTADLEDLFSAGLVPAKRTAGGALHAFHLVLNAGNKGGLLRELTYNTDEGLILFQEEKIEGILEFPVSELLTSSGTIENILNEEYPVFVYVPGTPYTSTIEVDSFQLLHLPTGVFPGKAITNRGNIYTLAETFHHNDSLRIHLDQVEHTIPLDSLPLDTTLHLISMVKYAIDWDTTFAPFWISEICDLKGHPNALIHRSFRKTSTNSPDSSWEKATRSITWSQLSLQTIMHAKKIIYISTLIDSAWVSNSRIEERRKATECNINNEPDEHIRLDSAEFLWETNWLQDYSLHFTSLEIDQLTGTVSTLDTVKSYQSSEPNELIPHKIPDTLKVRKWIHRNVTWEDTLWIDSDSRNIRDKQPSYFYPDAGTGGKG
jgi:hypothetical protein